MKRLTIKKKNTLSLKQLIKSVVSQVLKELNKRGFAA